ncbi:MAG: hypothetical protein K0S12_2526, partial [Bacteroidetes bacterium]|nr:hypothetical protein [Bacteroidota bacterium]
MKKCLLILLIALGFRSFSQNYYMNSVNNQTITTCKGNLLPSWLCTAFGYSGYCNNENYSVTFYSGNPLVPMKISFLPLQIYGFPTANVFYSEATYDVMTIINGPAAGSPTLATLSGAYANPMSFASTGPYLTIKWKSDNIVNDWGWNAIIGCQPQGCNGNLPASDACSGAVALCDLNGYCGATNGWYTPDNATLPFCGSVENNSWIKFIPNSTSATINVNVAACSSTAQGLQGAIYSTPNCVSFTSLACVAQATYSPVMTISYNSFVPGNTYYLMIDGYAGNACD